jgi:hypothetical protein
MFENTREAYVQEYRGLKDLKMVVMDRKYDLTKEKGHGFKAVLTEYFERRKKKVHVTNVTKSTFVDEAGVEMSP